MRVEFYIDGKLHDQMTSAFASLRRWLGGRGLNGGASDLAVEPYASGDGSNQPAAPPLSPGRVTLDDCQHPGQEHTVWWMWDTLDLGGHPIPDQARFDTREEAVTFAERGVAKQKDDPRFLWVKVFRSDNETYTCWRWERP